MMFTIFLFLMDSVMHGSMAVRLGNDNRAVIMMPKNNPLLLLMVTKQTKTNRREWLKKWGYHTT